MLRWFTQANNIFKTQPKCCLADIGAVNTLCFIFLFTPGPTHKFVVFYGHFYVLLLFYCCVKGTLNTVILLEKYTTGYGQKYLIS